MKKLVFFLIFAWGVCHAADAPAKAAGPKALDAADKADYLTLVNQVQQYQISLYQLQNQYKSTQDLLQQTYNQAVEKNKALQKKYEADGYHLTDAGAWEVNIPTSPVVPGSTPGSGPTAQSIKNTPAPAKKP